MSAMGYHQALRYLPDSEQQALQSHRPRPQSHRPRPLLVVKAKALDAAPVIPCLPDQGASDAAPVVASIPDQNASDAAPVPIVPDQGAPDTARLIIIKARDAWKAVALAAMKATRLPAAGVAVARRLCSFDSPTVVDDAGAGAGNNRYIMRRLTRLVMVRYLCSLLPSPLPAAATLFCILKANHPRRCKLWRITSVPDGTRSDPEQGVAAPPAAAAAPPAAPPSVAKVYHHRDLDLGSHIGEASSTASLQEIVEETAEARASTPNKAVANAGHPRHSLKELFMSSPSVSINNTGSRTPTSRGTKPHQPAWRPCCCDTHAVSPKHKRPLSGQSGGSPPKRRRAAGINALAGMLAPNPHPSRCRRSSRAHHAGSGGPPPMPPPPPAAPAPEGAAPHSSVFESACSDSLVLPDDPTPASVAQKNPLAPSNSPAPPDPNSSALHPVPNPQAQASGVDIANPNNPPATADPNSSALQTVPNPQAQAPGVGNANPNDPPAPADPNLQQPQPPLPQGQALVAAAAIQGGQPAPNPAPVAVDNVNPNDRNFNWELGHLDIASQALNTLYQRRDDDAQIWHPERKVHYTWALMSGFVVVACGILASTASIDLSFIRGVGSVCARLSSIGATTLVIYVLSDTVGRLPGFIFGGIATTFMILLWLAGNPEDRAIFFRLLVFILKMIFRLLLFIVKMIFWYPGVLLSTGLGYIKGWIQTGFSKAKNGIKAYFEHPTGQGAEGPRGNARVGP